MGNPKPLLAWQGKTLVEHQIGVLREAGAADIVVVLGHEAQSVAPLVWRAGARPIVNDHYAEGRTSSIKVGLGEVSDTADDVLLMGVDQPRTVEIVSRVIESHCKVGAMLTSPRHRGRGGHPLMFSVLLMPELMQISEENQGLREVFERHRAEINEVHFKDPLVRLDLNTPEAYRAALERYGGG